MLLSIGGFICGSAAGAAARYGQLCSMGAIEDAIVGGNPRSPKAWGLALASDFSYAWVAETSALS